MLSRAGGLFASGYSGAPGHINDSSAEAIKDIGPIPVGIYDIGEPRSHPRLGHYVLPLTPRPENVMHGRDSFFIHGDHIQNPGTASEGCIVLANFARQQIWKSGDHVLEVVKEMVTRV